MDGGALILRPFLPDRSARYVVRSGAYWVVCGCHYLRLISGPHFGPHSGFISRLRTAAFPRQISDPDAACKILRPLRTTTDSDSESDSDPELGLRSGSGSGLDDRGGGGGGGGGSGAATRLMPRRRTLLRLQSVAVAVAIGSGGHSQQSWQSYTVWKWLSSRARLQCYA